MAEEVPQTTIFAAPQAATASSTSRTDFIAISEDTPEYIDLTQEDEPIDLAQEAFNVLSTETKITTPTCIMFIEIVHSTGRKEEIKELAGPYIDNNLHHDLIKEDLGNQLYDYREITWSKWDYSPETLDKLYRTLMEKGEVTVYPVYRYSGTERFRLKLILHKQFNQCDAIKLLSELASGPINGCKKLFVVIAREREDSDVSKDPFFEYFEEQLFNKYGTRLFINPESREDCDHIQAFVTRGEALHYMRERWMKFDPNFTEEQESQHRRYICDFSEEEKRNENVWLERHVDMEGR